MGVLFIPLYIPVTWIFWRNVSLSGIWKPLFCLTILPVFLVLMVFNIWLTYRYAPWLFDHLDSSEGRLQALIAFVISCPVAVGLSFVWYKLISWFDTGTRYERGVPLDWEPPRGHP
jgi:hypothetical protein